MSNSAVAPIPSSRFAERRDKLLRELRRSEADTLLVTGVTNVSYLTGFTGDSSVLVIGPSVCVLISDSRFTTQIADECPGLDTFFRKVTETINDAIAKVLKKAKLSKVGVESALLSLASFESLVDACPKIEFSRTTGIVESLRNIKDTDEIRQIKHAVELAQRSFQVMRASLTATQTELDIRNLLEGSMRQFGAETAAFESIIAVGPQAALPHAHPGESLVRQSNHLLVDWGAVNPAGYRSDLTRVLITGKISSKLEKLYEVVLNAQLKSIAAIRPGVACSEVDQIARDHIDQAGYGKRFGHGLGHGIGLETHEAIRFSPSSKDVLKPGMVVTIEPGIYLPGWGGIRIEDDILVTKDGHAVLTSTPKTFEESIVSVS